MESVAVAWGEQREVSHRRHQVQVLHKGAREQVREPGRRGREAGQGEDRKQ